MLGLAEQERETYEQMWGVPVYSEYAPGEEYVEAFLEMSGAGRASSVLDAGCGTGKGAVALRSRGFEVTMCDLTGAAIVLEARRMHLPFLEACLWQDLRKVVGFHDWVYCCDVLEHVPPPFVMLVTSRLLEVARKGVFLSIALHPDDYGAWVGKPLHQTVQSFSAWRDQLRELGTMRECRDLINTGLYLVTPR